MLLSDKQSGINKSEEGLVVMSLHYSDRLIYLITTDSTARCDEVVFLIICIFLMCMYHQCFSDRSSSSPLISVLKLSELVSIFSSIES